MIADKTEIRDDIKRDITVLADFVEIFCAGRHADAERIERTAGGIIGRYMEPHRPRLCGDCWKLLLHGASKRIICPRDPKPRCKKCTDHCYAPGYREKIREVMSFSGMQLIRNGRLDLLKKYFF